MKNLIKLAIGAVFAAGVAVAASSPANAGTSIGLSFGVGGPPYYGPAYYPPYYGPAYYGPRYYRGACDYYSPYYDPYACDWPVYWNPIYFGGTWYTGPIRYRYWGGHRWYWVNRGWHRDEWRGPRPAHIHGVRVGARFNDHWNHGYHGGHFRGGVHSGASFHGNGAWRAGAGGHGHSGGHHH